jgi:hypothetical protein
MKLEKARKQARKIGGKLVEKPSQLENKQKNKDERLHLEEICFVLFGCFFNQSIKGKWKLVDGRIGNWLVDGRIENPRFERAEDQRIVVTRPLCLLHYPNRF